MSSKGVLSPLTEDEPRVRKAVFQLLVTRHEPIEPQALAEKIGMAHGRLTEVLDQLDRAGRIRRDAQGRVTGSAGLSVVPDRHEIDVSGERFWTWCAYDILGIFGALEANGSAHSPSPADGRTIELRFSEGRPEAKQVVLFRPDLSLAASCENVYEEWCPNSNLFADEAAALEWSEDRGLQGQVLTLNEASDKATAEWRPLIDGLSADR